MLSSSVTEERESTPQPSQNLATQPSDSWIKRFPNGEDLDGPKRWYCQPYFIQNMILLYGQKKSYFPLQIMVGPDWKVMSGTFLAIIIPSVFFIIYICENISRIMTYCTIAFFLFILISLSFTAFSDPGIIFNREFEIDPEASSAEQVIQCTQCNVKRPNTARHCYRCGVCVDQLDHHCAFVGKCIGKNNLYSFYAFAGSIYVHTYFVFGTTAYYLIYVLMVPAIRKSLNN